MKSEDWKLPFRKLRNRLRVLHDANCQLYHVVLMTPSHSHEEAVVVNELEPVYEGHNLVAEIVMPTAEGSYHAHCFFGDNGAFQQLGRELNGIRGWIQKIPKTLISEVSIPRLTNQTNENIVYWTSLVYQVAWALDVPYLQATVEFRPDHAEGAFLPWDECPQPLECDPRSLLFQNGELAVQIAEWQSQFTSEQLQPPEVIDAYLCAEESIVGEFLYRSLIAIDALVYVLEQEQAEQSIQRRNPIRQNPAKQKQMKKDTAELLTIIREHFSGDDKELSPLKPLTQKEMAERLSWELPDGTPDQVKVSRRMKMLFGDNPQKGYHKLFYSKSPGKGNSNRRGDGGYDVDGVTFDN